MPTDERHVVPAALEDGCSPAQIEEHHGLAEAQFEWISGHLNHLKRLTKAPIICFLFGRYGSALPYPNVFAHFYLVR
jgi:hypothetical protein